MTKIRCYFGTHFEQKEYNKQKAAAIERTRAQISRDAIHRLYIAMRHLFIRGSYKPLGASGEAIMDAMLSLKPEIYGDIADPRKVELDGLLYIFQRLPQGIEECRFVHLIGREGYEDSSFHSIVPSKRRRNCYRIDEDRMYIEMTRGRSDIYDLLTHLTFMYIEAEKIKNNSLDYKDRAQSEWKMLEKIVHKIDRDEPFNHEVATSYLSTLLGITFDEALHATQKFESTEKVNSLFKITYWLGRRSLDEHRDKNDREISFSNLLRDKIGHHTYGELWAQRVKKELYEKDLLQRPIHIISSNMHSVLNAVYAPHVYPQHDSLEDIAYMLSQDQRGNKQEKVRAFAQKNGLTHLDDISGMNISVQIIDSAQLSHIQSWKGKAWWAGKDEEAPVIVVMDYAFGEQAFETMDELLKPYEIKDKRLKINVQSVNIMGKAGILLGRKGDIMIATAFVFEGSADNYPFKNDFKARDFKGCGLGVYEGPMITVLGTSLQNKDILRYFLRSSWNCIGLEMEGAHYQKAIQAASQIRQSISSDITLRYAYYASDNPLETGKTLASGSLGKDGVKPTYLITQKILEGIFYEE